MKPVSNVPEKGASRRRTPRLSLSTFLPYRLNVLASVVSEGLARQYAGFSIGIPEWRVLATIGEFGSITSKAIARHAYMNKVQVARAVASLEARGAIRRTRNPDDLREHYLVFTSAGAELHRSVATLALAYTAQLTARISASDMEAFDRVAATLREAVARRDLPPPSRPARARTS